jgi:multimeric flavodoxin WrbA
MQRPAKITAIVGSYRKGGVIDRAVEELLTAAREAGAETKKIYLIDEPIEFCTNCRVCTQQAGVERGECVTDDRMGAILDTIAQSDALVLASPMNFGTVTAMMKRFIERLVCFAHWPWGALAPRVRQRERTKRAVVVASSAAPALLGRWLTSLVGLLKKTARLLGANRVDVLFIGIAGGEDRPDLGARAHRRARQLGKKLADHRDASVV